MIPIHELLNRIRWDAEFGGADFKIGYYDRVENDTVIVPLSRIYLGPNNRSSFSLYDASAGLRTIPLHRIRQVYRNGELIWERPF